MNFTSSPNIYLMGFLDADWGSDPYNRRNMNGRSIFLGCMSWLGPLRSNIQFLSLAQKQKVEALPMLQLQQFG